MNVKIRHLYHSGFAMQTSGHFLIFDYWRNMIDLSQLRGHDVIVFSSHNHRDHFNGEVLTWKESIPKLRLVLSDDIPAVPGAIMTGPGEILRQPDFTLETLASNDEGVAFVVDIDGLRIYHAGDLNWWHWEGEPDDYNAGMAASYKSEIDKLAGKPIDIAFVPVDPRLGAQYAWGIDYLMRTADVRHAVPMHFADDPSIVDKLLQDPVSQGYRDRILKSARQGEWVEI